MAYDCNLLIRPLRIRALKRLDTEAIHRVWTASPLCRGVTRSADHPTV